MSSSPKPVTSPAPRQTIPLTSRIGPATGRVSGYHGGTGPANRRSSRSRAACWPPETMRSDLITSSRPLNAPASSRRTRSRAGSMNPDPSRATQPIATSAQPLTVQASASAFPAGTLTAAVAAATAHARAIGAATCGSPEPCAPGPRTSLPIRH
jgi:hypothetical protein